MTLYTCKKCNKEFTNKTKYTTQTKNKNSCKRIEKNICMYCKETFTLHSSLKRHMMNRCKIKKNVDAEKEKLLQNLVKEKISTQDLAKKIIDNEQDDNFELLCYLLDKLKSKPEIDKKITNNTSTNIENININNQINNIQNNIELKILPFGKEDISYITDDIFKKIINKGFRSVPILVENVHFNIKHPQNHNVFISNMHDKYALIYDGNQWMMEKKDKVIDSMISEKIDTLTDMCDKLFELDDPIVRKFQRFLDKQDNDETVNSLKEDIKLILYNKVKKTTNEILYPKNKILTLKQ